MEATTVPAGQRADWRALAFFALGGLIATEVTRRIVTQPPAAKGWELMYWFTDHVFFEGKWIVLLAIALAPVRENLPLKFLGPATGLMLMVGSFLQLQDPIFLLLAGLLSGAILKSIRLTEPILMLLSAGGMLMGIPINGFTGVMAAKANFAPQLMQALFGATAGIGCLTVACSFTGLFLLGRYLWANRKS
ncbi:MAG: hypothetical protein FJW36_22810 [Acidobacteria bacterium]|nr:hypothetical protein [Acidobacteriota bacterium]